MDDERLSLVAKALGRPARIRIIRLLAAQTQCRGADVFSGLPLARSTVSEHMNVLKRAGIVRSHNVGAACVYCIDPDVLRGLSVESESIVDVTPGCSPGFEEC